MKHTFLLLFYPYFKDPYIITTGINVLYSFVLSVNSLCVTIWRVYNNLTISLQFFVPEEQWTLSTEQVNWQINTHILTLTFNNFYWWSQKCTTVSGSLPYFNWSSWICLLILLPYSGVVISSGNCLRAWQPDLGMVSREKGFLLIILEVVGNHWTSFGLELINNFFGRVPDKKNNY